MPRHHAGTAVLIADADLGFVTWLGAKLASSGYTTLPATSASAARQLIDQLRVRPDLAVVNLELAGRFELVEALHRANPALQLIAIADETHTRSEADWLATVERVLDLRKATRAS